MRIVALAYLLITIAGLGCTPTFLASSQEPVLASPGNATPIYNATEEPSAIEKSMAAVKSGSARLVNWTKSDGEPHPKPLDDSLSLNNMPQNVSPNLHLTMGKLMEKQGNIAAAERHFQEGLQLAANDPALLFAYAHLLDRQGRFQQATEKYIATAKLIPKDARVHNDLGLCFARQNQLDRSLEALNHAIKLAPQKALYRNNIATVLMEMDRKEEAWGHLKAVHPPAVAHYNFAFLLAKKQDNGAAFQHFMHASRLDPNLEAARHWAGRLQAHAPQRPAQAAPASVGPSLGSPSGGQARYPEQQRDDRYGEQRSPREANSGAAPDDRYYAPR